MTKLLAVSVTPLGEGGEMSDERFLGNCILCHTAPIEVRHINLYTVGSEGTYACHECEMKLVEFARNLLQENGRRKLDAKKATALQVTK